MHRQLFQTLFYSPCFFEIPLRSVCVLILQTLSDVSFSRWLTSFQVLTDKLANHFYLSKFRQVNLLLVNSSLCLAKTRYLCTYSFFRR
nr:MAG TPA: hypothetical protein [Caudoviricetes sp.]